MLVNFYVVDADKCIEIWDTSGILSGSLTDDKDIPGPTCDLSQRGQRAYSCSFTTDL
jgi:hypothetical protein